MENLENEIDRFPGTITQRAGARALTLARSSELCALRVPLPRDDQVHRVGELTGDDGARFVLCRLDEGARRAGAGAIAIYTDQATHRVVVPTGRVFVRFRDGMDAAAQGAAFARAGYRLVRALDYAANAAWVEALDGDAASALGGLARLAALEGVENVEPQLLEARALK